ncbi:hypothetical protein DY000_02040203 [Brassica cretica]|uniref:Chromo domain-containing protein n=1 Tax=Brassica cretica TaxID=69181 RepID=A0ABQ7BKN4_BRACR|nr:hypothetical protein DY000_02040203 [Brassica cretica]
MSGSKGDEALAEYKKALEIIRSYKRQAVAAAAPSSSKRKTKALGSSPIGFPSAIYDWATVLTNLNAKVFPSTPVLLASEEDSSMAIQSLQGDLLQRMEGAASTKVEMDTLASQLREEKDASLAKDKEIKVLRLKEELNDLKDAAETFEAEKAMAVNGAKIVARWELRREWLSGQTDSWDPVNTLEQYKTVKITEDELLGLPAPSFEYEPQVPSEEEVKKTPEPTADDPPAN